MPVGDRQHIIILYTAMDLEMTTLSFKVTSPVQLQMEDFRWSYANETHEGITVDSADPHFTFAVSGDYHSLTIVNPTLFDAGNYTLSATTHSSSSNSSITLVIQGKVHKIL